MQEESLAAYRARTGIVGDSLPSAIAMLTDCKSGGYNREGYRASVERLTRRILLIPIAYSVFLMIAVQKNAVTTTKPGFLEGDSLI